MPVAVLQQGYMGGFVFVSTDDSDDYGHCSVPTTACGSLFINIIKKAVEWSQVGGRLGRGGGALLSAAIIFSRLLISKAVVHVVSKGVCIWAYSHTWCMAKGG